MTSRAEMMAYAMDELRKIGVPETNLRAAAAHLVGQAEMESGLNPSLSHDQGTGFGIYGARLDRRTKMLDWLSRNGYAGDSGEGQMRYMAREAMGGEYPRTRDILMGATEGRLGVDSRGVTADFERPTVINDRSGAVLKAYYGDDTQVPAQNALPEAANTNALQTRYAFQNSIPLRTSGASNALRSPFSITLPWLPITSDWNSS